MKRILLFTVAILFVTITKSQTATEIIKKSDDKMQGESNYSEMTMQVIRPTWTRSVSFKSCSKGRDYTMTLITAPAKDKGQTFLKRQNDMWSWNPSINRLIKMPASMMSQGWMGSDYSNDDILKESSIVVDFNHKIIGSEVFNGKDCYKIELLPKANAAVVWGKIEKWISKNSYIQMKSMYYDEENELIKTDIAFDIKMMGGREIPTRFEIIPADKPNQKTVITITKSVFDMPVNESFFSQQNMKNGESIKFPVK